MPPLLITKNMVTKVFSSLKVDKSPGLDEMHPKKLKELQEEIADGLTIIFNKSLTSKEIPIVWKKARVVAIYKKKKQESRQQLQACKPHINCVQGDGNSCERPHSRIYE